MAKDLGGWSDWGGEHAGRQVSMAGSGEREAVFERYFERVYAYVAYRVVPDREAARDITQEVFLAAFKAWGEFRGESTALTWLRGIARNKVAGYFRAMAVRRGVGMEGVEGIVAEGEQGMSERQERAMLVSRVMRELAGNYGELLEEKYLEGMAVKEMAEKRGMSEKAVESALTRAREAFRQAYQRLQQHCA
ncbi:MAG: RNA polymerase sigma factor [Bacillota bacterium]